VSYVRVRHSGRPAPIRTRAPRSAGFGQRIDLLLDARIANRARPVVRSMPGCAIFISFIASCQECQITVPCSSHDLTAVFSQPRQISDATQGDSKHPRVEMSRLPFTSWPNSSYPIVSYNVVRVRSDQGIDRYFGPIVAVLALWLNEDDALSQSELRSCNAT